MRLIKCRLNALAGRQGLVTGEAAGDRAIKERARHGILQARAHAQLLQIADIQHHIGAAGARRMEVDGKEQPGDPDFVVLKAVVTRVGVSVHFQCYLRMQFLLDADFKIILGISADVAHALVRIGGKVADKAGEQ